jgi:hypothetical protein
VQVLAANLLLIWAEHVDETELAACMQNACGFLLFAKYWYS